MDQEIKLVWSADYGQGEQVYMSSYEKGIWTSPLQLSQSTDVIYHSSLSTGEDQQIWAVWARRDGNNGNILEFTVCESSKCSQPRQINTGMNNNNSPSIIVDAQKNPWVAWVGVEKLYSDVFLSRWNGKGWSPPIKVHPDNNVPDIDPKLAVDGSGQVTLSWKTFSDGKYSIVSKIWDGMQWQMAPQGSSDKISNRSLRGAKNLPPVPGFVKEPRRSKLFIKDRERAESFSLSDF